MYDLNEEIILKVARCTLTPERRFPFTPYPLKGGLEKVVQQLPLLGGWGYNEDLFL